MKQRFLKAGFLGSLAGVMLFQMTVLADVDKLNISQMIQNGKDVYLYVNTLDNTGKSTDDTMDAAQISVTIDKSETLQVTDAAVSSSLDQGTCYSFCIDISKSVTETEMQEIKSSMESFVDQMRENDYIKVITIGSEIQTICDYTQDKNSLKTAIDGIERTANNTYLYKGLSYALDGQRKAVATMPKRAEVIVFTDGMDDSDGASNEQQVLADIEETKIPIYMVGLKGQDSSANLNSVGQIARQSGGTIFSYNDMSVGEALQEIKTMTENAWQLHVVPAQEDFGKENLNWTVAYDSETYTVNSSTYTYSLGMDGVTFEIEKVTEIQTEAPTEIITEDTELITEAPTELITESPTEAELSGMEKLTVFIRNKLVECIVIILSFAALLIWFVIFMKNRKKDAEFETYRDSEEPDHGYNITKNEVDDMNEMTTDDDWTIMDDFDDEKTISEDTQAGIMIQFDITFDGHTEKEQRILRDKLILGRGSECDVDVVLKSPLEERKQTSRKHAYILARPDGIYVRDNSKNKTYLNGMEVVDEMTLRDGDMLQMGRASVKIRILNY